MIRAIILLITLVLAKHAASITITIDLKNNYVSGRDKKYAQLKGGDTLLLQPGVRDAIQFADFEGAPQNYLTIMNADGLTEINAGSLPYGISIRNCHYIRLSGQGSAKNKYGIKISGVTHGSGLGISDRSDNMEINNLEISNTEGPGILCKTNPDCISYRQTFTAYNFSIHNNYIHHTGTEGMYIGSTAFEGTQIKCNGDTVTELPSLLDGVDVFENLVEYSGWDGIQVSDALHVRCYHNQIHFDSQKEEKWQNCGLIIGGGAQGRFYENVISNGRGFPINCFGNGTVEITNNRIIQDSISTKTAIYVNDKLAYKLTKYMVADNIIITQSFPAIMIVNEKGRAPDLVKHNLCNGKDSDHFIAYEGIKPSIK